MNTMDTNIFTMAEEEQTGPCGLELMEFGPEISGTRIAIHCTRTNDRDILGVGCTEQGLVHLTDLTFKSAQNDFSSAFHIMNFTGDGLVTGPFR